MVLNLSIRAEIHRAEFQLLEPISELDCQPPRRHEAMPSCAHWRNAHCGSAPLACDSALVRILTSGAGKGDGELVQSGFVWKTARFCQLTRPR